MTGAVLAAALVGALLALAFAARRAVLGTEELEATAPGARRCPLCGGPVVLGRRRIGSNLAWHSCVDCKKYGHGVPIGALADTAQLADVSIQRLRAFQVIEGRGIDLDDVYLIDGRTYLTLRGLNKLIDLETGKEGDDAT